MKTELKANSDNEITFVCQVYLCLRAEYVEVEALVYLWIGKHHLALLRLGSLFLREVLMIILDFVRLPILNFCRLI